MKRIGFKLTCVTALALFACAGAAAAEKQPVLMVRGPTIIAFCSAATQAEYDAAVAKDPDLQKTLNDFQFHTGSARKKLRGSGIRVEEIYAHYIVIRSGQTANVFRTSKPGELGLGYYFVAPGKQPRIERTVMTDADLIELAHKYFGTQAK
jgi:hypothetical protein